MFIIGQCLPAADLLLVAQAVPICGNGRIVRLRGRIVAFTEARDDFRIVGLQFIEEPVVDILHEVAVRFDNMMAFTTVAPTIVFVCFTFSDIIDILVAVVGPRPDLALYVGRTAIRTAIRFFRCDLLLLEARLGVLAACTAMACFGFFERVSVVIHGEGIARIGADPSPDIHFAGAALAATNNRVGRGSVVRIHIISIQQLTIESHFCYILLYDHKAW